MHMWCEMTQKEIKKNSGVEKSRAVNETSSQSYGMSLEIWDHNTMLPASNTSEHTLP